jgi:hypothetical protein
MSLVSAGRIILVSLCYHHPKPGLSTPPGPANPEPRPPGSDAAPPTAPPVPSSNPASFISSGVISVEPEEEAGLSSSPSSYDPTGIAKKEAREDYNSINYQQPKHYHIVVTKADKHQHCSRRVGKANPLLDMRGLLAYKIGGSKKNNRFGLGRINLTV